MTPSEMHAEIVTQFVAAGHPDARTVTYTPPGGDAVTCQVMFTSPSHLSGDSAAPIMAQQQIVRLLRSQVPSPVQGAVITLTSGDQWRLVDPLDESPDSSTVWSVTRVRS
jgi:hypothetical protein